MCVGVFATFGISSVTLGPYIFYYLKKSVIVKIIVTVGVEPT